ncbi:zinc-binding dehydrogenase [Paenibacillus sp. LHD-117]|uniref:zinc-binding dehydrogenase n=1 Tax=Paenibacillus sp. LHD-117 TaxID=3071412 RepID=UPI0027E14BD9|nr:zinc-binding dehydrogenase [Paenibacillus sp. LHD-117]MDQ6418029.1 zinc-binding dehydrogenase [Paenibacillus sp. LHD-117]
MSGMRAIAQEQAGGPETLRIVELDIPSPGPGEILIRMMAASLNPVDYKVMGGGHPNWTYPHVPGVDGAGIVQEIGSGVTEWKIGDRVVFHADFTRQGVCSEYAVTTAHTAARIPASLSFEAAAAFPCAGLTAYQALVRKMKIQPGQSIFIHAGAGGVGGYAIQIAKLLGADRIISSASAGNAEYVRSLGADEVIDYTCVDVHERISELTDGLGVDLILNSINRATAQKDLSALAYSGQLACIAGAPEIVADFQPSTKTFTVHKLMLGGAHNSGNRQAEEDLARMSEEFLGLMEAGYLNPLIGEVISLAEVGDALKRFSERHVRGKIVVKLM